ADGVAADGVLADGVPVLSDAPAVGVVASSSDASALGVDESLALSASRVFASPDASGVDAVGVDAIGVAATGVAVVFSGPS
ncbi:MAG TPA: hypothetical protein VFX19_02085, partial [Dehalococcoidia bacterium]|nr:hypothetical protein [Dehalococcoidia bacterium]